MKAFKYILFLLLIVFIGVAIYVAVQPNTFEVKRERIINAPASVIYDNVIDFKNWEAWSSWVEKDPSTVITLGEQTKGVNGSYSWIDKDGKGSMKTLSTTPNLSIEQQLQFDTYEPSIINWFFEPTDDGKTKVTWKMNSDHVPFLFKGFAAFSGGFDTMIGPDFERGLEKLDSIVVTSMKVYSIKIDGITEHSGGFYLYNTTSCKIDELALNMQDMLPKVGAYAIANNITMAGPAFVIYHKWDLENNAVMFSCCVPTTNKVITTESSILTGQLEPFRALKTTLKGDYSNLKETWNKTMSFIQNNDLEVSETGPMLEVYVTDPMAIQNPAEWITELYVAIQ